MAMLLYEDNAGKMWEVPSDVWHELIASIMKQAGAKQLSAPIPNPALDSFALEMTHVCQLLDTRKDKLIKR